MLRAKATFRLAAVLLLGLHAPSSPADETAGPTVIPVEDTSMLSGRAIYDRVLDNRFRSVSQVASLTSGDRVGRAQETRFTLQWRDYRIESTNGDAPVAAENGADDGEAVDAPPPTLAELAKASSGEVPEDGVLSKTIIRYTHPFDVRHSGYLVLNNHERVNDQFVYFPSRRQTVRVNLRSEPVFGTDFSVEDVIPREIEESTYERLTDEMWKGRPVFVIRLIPRNIAESEYSRFVIYVDRERFVPLRTRYWDEAGVEVKELTADPDKVQQHGDIWVPMKTTMKNLILESFTILEVTELIPNPELSDNKFELRRLEADAH